MLPRHRLRCSFYRIVRGFFPPRFPRASHAYPSRLCASLDSRSWSYICKLRPSKCGQERGEFPVCRLQWGVLHKIQIGVFHPENRYSSERDRALANISVSALPRGAGILLDRYSYTLLRFSLLFLFFLDPERGLFSPPGVLFCDRILFERDAHRSRVLPLRSLQIAR